MDTIIGGHNHISENTKVVLLLQLFFGFVVVATVVVYADLTLARNMTEIDLTRPRSSLRKRVAGNI